MSAPAFPLDGPVGAAWIAAPGSEPVRAWFVHPSRPHLGWMAGTVVLEHDQVVDVTRPGMAYPIRLPRRAVVISPLAEVETAELLAVGGVAQIPGHPDVAMWPGDPDRSVRVLEPPSGWALVQPGLVADRWVPIVGTGYLAAAPAPGWVALRPDPDQFARIPRHRQPMV